MRTRPVDADPSRSPNESIRRAAELVRPPATTNLGPAAPAAGWPTAIERAGTQSISGPPTQVRGEPELPEAAARKLAKMRADAEDLNNALRALSDRRGDQHLRLQRAAARLQHLNSSGSARLHESEDHPSWVQATSERDEAMTEMASLDTRIAGLRARTPRVLAGITQYLASLRADAYVGAHPPVVVPEGATIDDSRSQIAELRADIHHVRSAPMHSSHVKRMWADAIAARAKAPNVLHTLEGAPVDWPHVLTRAELFGHAVATGAPPLAGIAQGREVDTFGLLCWLAGDGILARIEAEIDELSDDTEALSDEERAEREAALQARILEVERVECALIEASPSEVAYRNDCDPRAVLGLSSDLPGPRER